DAAVVPALVVGPRGACHVVGEDDPELEVGERGGALREAARVRAGPHLEGRGVCAGHDGLHRNVADEDMVPVPARGGNGCERARAALGAAPRPAQPATRAAISSPISVVVREAAARRSARSAMSFSTASLTRAASSARPRWSSSSETDRIAAVGSALPWPAMSGAEPWTGSNIEGCSPVGLTLPDAASPMPPVIAAARSVRMSPNRLSVTMTSYCEGFVVR